MTTIPRTTLGNIMLKQDNPFEDIAMFQRELELRPHLAAAHDGLRWAYLKLNRLAESRTAFKAAVKYQPLNSLSHKGLKEVKQRVANKNMGKNTPLLASKSIPNKRNSKTYQN
jgi:tetratricopeptide (TPR) repeat protein|tara:strand:- start:2405 stop:2743 length:339 start_codon:yes stop_codon:yes gene_type:complete